MKCRHGVTGYCVRCEGESLRKKLLLETGRLVRELAGSHGLDTTRLDELLKALGA